jgi:hypothetical protein
VGVEDRPSKGDAVPRKKQEPVQAEVARAIGGLLRGLRRAAGYRAVRDAASVPGCPAAQQTIYAYERGGLVPSLKQFMDLVEFYALRDGASEEVRYRGVAALVAALASPAYHLPDAWNLISRLQPAPAAGRRRRAGRRTGRMARKTTRTAAKSTGVAAKGTRTAAKGTRVAPARIRRVANTGRAGRASRVAGPTRRTAGRATGATRRTERRATGVRRPVPESRRR